ncbi:MAG: ABC transporter ATP-binding protein [Rudaea sp.]
MNAPVPSEAPILVSASALGKSYPKVFRPRDRLRALGKLLVGRDDVASVPVLRDVNLRVRRGESLGLIGENGAGKSTLLKLLTGVLTPTTGSVEVSGRIGALLELGAGFNVEYSGRENIAMSAALYGLRGEEMDAKLPQIIAFADIGRYIDEPVKHYSSGMVVRLGFAIVAALRPDLLITDEVLAVGDESFQKKCVRWIEDYLGSGGTLILVSHSMYHIQKLCRQACWLRDGAIAASGDVFDVTQAYLAFHERKLAAKEAQGTDRAAKNLEFSMIDVDIVGAERNAPLFLERGATLRVSARTHSRDGRLPVIAFGILRIDGTAIYGVSTELDGMQATRESEHVFSARIVFPDLVLLPGTFVLRAMVMDTEAVRLFDVIEREFTVRGSTRELGTAYLAHSWEGMG